MQNLPFHFHSNADEISGPKRSIETGDRFKMHLPKSHTLVRQEGD